MIDRVVKNGEKTDSSFSVFLFLFLLVLVYVGFVGIARVTELRNEIEKHERRK